jgi:hypothetical protein
MPADYFSVRWTRTVYYAGGQYHLQSQEVVSDITYDDYGRITANLSQFTETNLVAGDGTLNKTYRVYSSNTFDKLDRITGYTRTTAEGMKTTTENTAAAHTYSKRGNILQTALHIVEDSSDGTVDSTTDATTTFSGFDAWGRVTGYTRTTLDRDMKTVETASSLAYYPSGQAKSSVTSFHLTDVHTGGVPAEGTDLDRSWTVTTTGMGYNNLGLTNAYARTTVENGKTTLETMTAAAYDADGRLSGSTISYTETGAGTSYTDPDTSITYTTPALNHTWTATMANADYYGSGQMSYYEKTTADGTKNTLEKTSISYDSSGRASDTAIQYTETDNSAGALMDHTFTVRTQSTFDNGWS